jgi:anti-sigma regulatory factor (Ser/Thr protein kinase)
MKTESHPAPNDFSLTFSFESRLERVWVIRAVLEGILSWIGVPDTETMLIQLAASEIASNAIEHGYRCEPSQRIDITITLTGVDLEVVVIDEAPPMPVDRLKEIYARRTDDVEPDENWTSRGHGLQIVRQAVDSLSFSRVDNRNLVALRKRLTLVPQ